MNPELDPFEKELEKGLKALGDEVSPQRKVYLQPDDLEAGFSYGSLIKWAAFIALCLGLGYLLGERWKPTSAPPVTYQVPPSLSPNSVHREGGTPTEVIYKIQQKGDVIYIEGLPPIRTIHEWQVKKGQDGQNGAVENVRYEWAEVY